MQSEFTTVRLGEIAEVRSGFAFKSSDMGTLGIPLIKIRNIVPPTVDIQDVERVPEQVIRNIPNAERYKLRPEDILIAMTGATVGKVGRIPKTKETLYLNQRVGKLYLKDPTVADYDFIYYVLSQAHYVDQLFGWADGSAQPNISGLQIERLEIPLPPVAEQQAIAHILGTLDAKIELDRRLNETLEAIAKALFKSWFIDFDPVRAKMDGREPGLSNHLADLFPESIENSAVGDIPKGWIVSTVGELADIVGGSTPSTKEPVYWNGAYHWATPKDLSALKTPVLLDTERSISGEGLAQISSGLLPKGTVLLSSRAPIGYLAIAEVPVAINQGFIAMKAKEGVSNLFLLFWASSSHDAIVSRANGSTFLEISKANFRPISVIRPPREVMGAFDAQVRPLYNRIVENERERRTLATLRDALLPKLISGEIRVADPDRVIGRRP